MDARDTERAHGRTSKASGSAVLKGIFDGSTESIQSRIVRGYFSTIGLALLLSAGAILAGLYLHFQQAADDDLRTMGRVIGANLQASLLFDDVQAAEETLRALKFEEAIEAALVYDERGELFARYVREGVLHFRPPSDLPFEPSWTRDHIDLATPVRVDGDELGIVYLRSDTRAVARFLKFFVLVLGAVVSLSCGLCWLGAIRLRRQIADPLGELVAGSVAMAEGDLSTRVEVASDDEVGVVARAFNRMGQSLRSLIAQVGDNTRYVAQATEQLAHASESMREEAALQEQAVEETAESIEHIISSIHSVSASVEALSDSAAETSSAAIEMDSSIAAEAHHIDQLSEIIESTSSSVVQMTSAIRDITSSADALNQSTESTAQALELLSGSVRQVESNARESHGLSEATAQKAAHGVSAVQETVGGMQEIQVSFRGLDTIISSLSSKSESIGEVVKVIESVVEQTNLLALNAAIISSQAGEHGRAFAVVADEIRNLAERTAASTREIADLIESVQGGVFDAVAAMGQGATRVERGVELSNEAGRILREIGESAQQSTRWAREIVEATRSQAADIDQVGIAMSQVKDIAMQLNRGTHEQDSASTEITRGVEQMRQLGLEVRSAAQEQRRESSLITRSVEVVAAKIREIAVAAKGQSKRADQIQEALHVFREVTLQSSRRAEQTGATVRELSEHAESLEQEIGRFRL